MMNRVTLEVNKRKTGAFILNEDKEQLGEMAVSISGSHLTVYHTEVAPAAEGKGLAKKMLQAMVDYARQNGLKVIPLCAYVHAQFKRHAQEYADLWQAQDEKEETV